MHILFVKDKDLIVSSEISYSFTQLVCDLLTRCGRSDHRQTPDIWFLFLCGQMQKIYSHWKPYFFPQQLTKDLVRDRNKQAEELWLLRIMLVAMKCILSPVHGLVYAFLAVVSLVQMHAVSVRSAEMWNWPIIKGVQNNVCWKQLATYKQASPLQWCTPTNVFL